MTSQELIAAGKLQEAIQSLSKELRDMPNDTRRRTFLFELLCFAGDYTRAEKHLSILSEASADAGVGALFYRSAMAAEKKRQAFFETKQYAGHEGRPMPRTGKINGEPFRTIEDIDPRIGARLEVYIAGEYVWLPFPQIGTITIGPPRYLRDLLWSPATVTAGPAGKSQDMGEVIVPILYPFSSNHERDAVKLGHETDWVLSEHDPIEIPYGQKLFVLDSERTIPILEIRSLEYDDSVPQEIASGALVS